MDTTTKIPRLSIGLPVYNGALHLREAIASLLAQDVEDLELVICDNASTDDTQAICAEFAAEDSRVSYVRNESNIGAAPNFNRAFELCRGEYFMWGSHDDVWEPEFASACIARLEDHPDAVLCTSQVRLIGDDGTTKDENYEVIDTDGMTFEDRVMELLRRPVWYDMYSVFRPEALRATGMYSVTFGGDVHLLLELILLGDFLSVPQVLFNYRIPDRLKDPSDMTKEIGVDEAKREQHDEPWSFLARDLALVIQDSGLDTPVIDSLITRFVSHLGSKESSWGRAILRERGWVILPPVWVTKREIEAVLGPQLPQSAPLIALRRAQVRLVRLGRSVKALGRRLRRSASDR
jgi:glycosyltransferase involved in cell wall biosynthesis